MENRLAELTLALKWQICMLHAVTESSDFLSGRPTIIWSTASILPSPLKCKHREWSAAYSLCAAFEGREGKKTTKQTVFLVPLTSSRFALAGCLAYAGCDKGCRGGEVGIRWGGTDCSCCQYSGLEDLAWAEPRKWQPSVAAQPNTHTGTEENGVAKNTQGQTRDWCHCYPHASPHGAPPSHSSVTSRWMRSRMKGRAHIF